MSKKCFTVRIEVEALVVAENEAKAKKIGFDALKEEIDLLTEDNVALSIATVLPRFWTDTCYVYGEDIMAAKALKLNSKDEVDIELEKSILQAIERRNLLIKEINKNLEEAYKKEKK